MLCSSIQLTTFSKHSWSTVVEGIPIIQGTPGSKWCPLVNRTGQIGQTFVRDMYLLKSQSKGCMNPAFDPAHKYIFALYLQGRICTVGTWDLPTQYFEIYVPVQSHFRRLC